MDRETFDVTLAFSRAVDRKTAALFLRNLRDGAKNEGIVILSRGDVPATMTPDVVSVEFSAYSSVRGEVATLREFGMALGFANLATADNLRIRKSKDSKYFKVDRLSLSGV